MLHLPLRVEDEATALKLLRRHHRGLFHLFFSPRIRPLSDEPKGLPRFELIWMPYHVIVVTADTMFGPSQTTVSVEGWQGSFAIFQRSEDVVEGVPDGEAFDTKITVDEACHIAKRRTLEYLLRRRGANKPKITGTAETQCIWFPYWVYYFQSRRKNLDIRLVDGATGEVPGGQLRVAALEAFISKSS